MGVFTKLSRKDIQTLLARFPNLPKADFQFEGVATGTVNTYYKITFATKPASIFYLKRDEVADLKRLKNEIEIFKLLKKQKNKLSFKTPLPQQTQTKEFFTIYKRGYYLVFDEVKGRSLYDELNSKHIRILGQKLAELHRLPASSTIKPHRFNLLGLQKTLKSISPALGQRHPHILKQIQTELKSFGTTIKSAEQQRTLIHADLFPENALWMDNTFSGLIDFEAGGLGSALFDIGVCLHALCFDKNNKPDSDFVKNFLQGYQSIRKLKPSDIKLVPQYLRLTCLRFLITRLKDFELPNVPSSRANFKDYRQYLQRLQQLDDLLNLTAKHF